MGEGRRAKAWGVRDFELQRTQRTQRTRDERRAARQEKATQEGNTEKVSLILHDFIELQNKLLQQNSQPASMINDNKIYGGE